MSEGELGKRIHQKIIDGEGKVSYAFGITPIIEEMKATLLRGQPELSPQTIRWFEFWLGKIGYDAKQTKPLFDAGNSERHQDSYGEATAV